MSRVVVKVRYGDFWVDDLPSAAVDLQVLSQIHSAMMLASLQGSVVKITESNDDTLKDFPPVCVEWGKSVDYQHAIKIPEGEYHIETASDPKVVAFAPTGSPRGVSFPVSHIGGHRSRQKMYGRRLTRAEKRHSAWDIVTHAIETAFDDRVNVIIRKEENGETVVTVFDRTSNKAIVWYRYLGDRKIDQQGTCLSGSERTLSPFAVVAAYYQMLDTNRTVADGVVVFQ